MCTLLHIYTYINIIIIKVLSQLCWYFLHEFCFSILIYLEPNPHISCTSSDLFLVPPSTSSSAYPFPTLPLGGLSTCIAKLFLTNAVASLRWTYSNHLKQVSLILSPINALESAHFLFYPSYFYNTLTSTFSSPLHPFCAYVLFWSANILLHSS